MRNNNCCLKSGGIMSLQSNKTIGNEVSASPAKFRSRAAVPWAIPGLMVLALFVTAAARATSVLDPEPENSTTQFGRAIADIGDVNGDGVPDLAVGAPFQDGDFEVSELGFGDPQNVGKVWVLNGATRAVITQLNDPEFQQVQDQKFGGQFGWSVAPAGDVNGDGIPDVIVGTPHHTVIEEDEDVFSVGRTFVFSGATDTVLLTLDNPTVEENARAGTSVVSLGDVNRDGVADVLVGAPGQDVGDEEEGGLADVGVAYLYSGANGALLRTLNHPEQDGAEVNARFGSAVANAGDVNGDRVSDALIGAPGRGEAFVFSGKTGALIFTILSPRNEKLPSFGSAVAGGKDLDNDGIPDFAVGAPLLRRSQGGVFLFRGSDGTLLRRLRPPIAQQFSKFGAAITLIADVTGDERPDVFVGAPEQDVNGLINAGQAYIYDGAGGSLFQTLTSETPQAFAGFGLAVDAIDFSGDGTPTAVVGVPFQNAELIDPEDGDLVFHLQIGQIEIQ
ncbi:MAG: FG-GAP repeat protein [Chthoniobacterales bacterium]|nr:FG-GAP repeat protein [Chthoniobacterales bacterium]